MDSSNTTITSSSTNSDCSLVRLPSKRDLFFLTFCRNQEWSLPDSIIFYKVKNPSSPKCYEKLIKPCKYFFIKNPILVVKRLSLWFEGHECSVLLDDEFVDLRNISSKLWITNEIVVKCEDEKPDVHYFSSAVLPKIYKSGIKRLIFSHQNLFLNDLSFLASKCECIQFYKVTVKNENGDVVTLDKIFGSLHNVTHFWYDFEDTDPKMITSKTVKEMIKISHFHSLDKLELIDAPESFNLNDFYSYIKKNNQTIIRVRFHNPLLSDAYKQRLQEIVNEIVQTENHSYKIPYIYFYDIEHSAFGKIRKLHYSD